MLEVCVAEQGIPEQSWEVQSDREHGAAFCHLDLSIIFSVMSPQIVTVKPTFTQCNLLVFF